MGRSIRAAMALSALLAASCNSSDSSGPAGPPTVVSRFPSNGATNAEAGTYVLAAFDRSMNAATITPSTFTLTLAGAPVPELIFYSDGTHTRPRRRLSCQATRTMRR